MKDIFGKLPAINAEGVTILLVEQDVKRPLKLPTRGYAIEHGRIVMQGTSDHLLNDDGLRKAYLGL